MDNGQLYLANVNWRGPNDVAALVPGRLQIPVVFDTNLGCFEACVPAYARENGRDMQLAVRSTMPCTILGPNGAIPMFEIIHADTGDHWWIEKGPWERRAQGYHDAPSFHRPGGTVNLQVGNSSCHVHLYEPSITADEFAFLLDDIKNWCWRMAIDENCYVTVAQNSEVRMLSTEFVRMAEEFIRHVTAAFDLPHCELRESLEVQRMDRLRPNNHSIRFLTQHGESAMVPGRCARQHYDTPENRFAYAMLKRVASMLRWTTNATRSSGTRFERTAAQYESRALDLITKRTEHVDASVLEEMLSRARAIVGKLQPLLAQGYQRIKVTAEQGYLPNWHKGEYNGTFAIIELGSDPDSTRIRSFLSRCGSAMVVGSISVEQRISSRTSKPYIVCRISDVRLLDAWRDYERECAQLEQSRESLEATQWERQLPHNVVMERQREGHTLRGRAAALREGAVTANADAERLNMLLGKSGAADRKATSLLITADLRFVPTMVFLQSPAYAGALSAYRRLISLTGVDETAMQELIALEDVGLRDWPGVYERWCLVCLLQVLQDDLRFEFDKVAVRENLLKYCTGKTPGTFSLSAMRSDMGLTLTLTYQAKLPNGRVPDFLLRIRDNQKNTTISCVLDAKACNFRRKPKESPDAPTIYVDDSLHDLVVRKNYGEDGANSVFVLHASRECIAQPTTLQPWATASSYGGDIVFAWESERPRHRQGCILMRPGETAHLKRLIILLLQRDLKRSDVCAACGSGGADVEVGVGHGVGEPHRCKKCGFFSIISHCFNCKEPIAKNQAWWTFHDLHPTDVWNIKCCSCGALLKVAAVL